MVVGGEGGGQDKRKEFSLLHKRKKRLYTRAALCSGGGFQRHLEAVKKPQTKHKKKQIHGEQQPPSEEHGRLL